LISRTATAKVTALAVMAVLIAGGAVGIYFYTAAPSTTTTTTSSSSSTSQTTSSSSQGVTPAGGSQDKNGQPQGAWADYLGYIPSGYVLAPHYSNANKYPCPSGMDPAQCTQFQASCGNGVCDPNESCATCAIDCGVPGDLTCDPYTGRAGSPVSVCQIQH
jgi:hypothetical protein